MNGFVDTLKVTYNPDRRHTPADRLPVRRQHLVRRQRRSTARRPDKKPRKINWSAITSFVTAAAAVGALVYTDQSLRATRDQLALTEQGQFTDRYAKAIEQLGQQGADRLQIRLGAIYSLERLARDSHRDQPTIIEVLSTFVRTSVQRTVAIGSGSGVMRYKCPDNTPSVPVADVQAALTVLGRRNATYDNDTTIDLSNSCLTGVKLRGAYLGRAKLIGTGLGSADLRGAGLTLADLDGADLSGANLSSTTFKRRGFKPANLRDMSYRPTDLRSANLSSATLNGANLLEADLRGAILMYVVHDESTVITGVRTDPYTVGLW